LQLITFYCLVPLENKRRRFGGAFRMLNPFFSMGWYARGDSNTRPLAS
jgi:hypothetical protein